jgi:uncharacterized membrane protein
MNAELVQPNLHIALVHFPIALLAVGVFLETFSFLGWRRSSIRTAARWMILLGAVLAAPVASSGIYALFDVRDSIPADEYAAEIVYEHVLFASIATSAALLICAAWIALSDDWRRKLHIPLLIILLLSTTLMLSAAHHGGQMVYEKAIGVTVASQDDQAEPETPATKPAGVAGMSHRVAPVLPPLQTHMILGGLASAMAIVSIGVSSRAMLERAAPVEPGERHDGDAIAAAFTKPLADVVLIEERQIRAAPIIWLGVLIGLSASLTGWWYVAHDSDIWNIAELWKNVTDRSLNEGRLLTRRTAHVIAGVSIVGLPLILLAISRFRPRARLLWLAASVLILLAIAAQVWLGQLMLLDESRIIGPVTRWSTP